MSCVLSIAVSWEYEECYFLKFTGPLDSQTAVLHSHLKDIFVFIFQRILLSPRFTSCYYAFPFQGYKYFYFFSKEFYYPLVSCFHLCLTDLKNRSMCLCGVFSALDKEYGSQSILPPWALFTNIQLSNKQHTWPAHKCKCIQTSQRVMTVIKIKFLHWETQLFSCICMKGDPDTGEKQDTEMRDKGCICKWLTLVFQSSHLYWYVKQAHNVRKINRGSLFPYIIKKSHMVTCCVKGGLWNLQCETVTPVLQHTAQVKAESSVVVYLAQDSAWNKWNKGCPAQMWSHWIKLVVARTIYHVFLDGRLTPSLTFPWLLTQKSSPNLFSYLFHQCIHHQLRMKNLQKYS